MTRVIVYSGALFAFVAATAMTFASLTLPLWIAYTATPTLTSNYGLHKLCQAIDLTLSTSTSPSSPLFSPLSSTSDLSGKCRAFPIAQDCPASEAYFCGLWKTTGWLMNFTAVLELVICVTFVVVLAGGKQKREQGWKLVVVLLVIAGLVQAAGGSIVAYLFDHDEKFNVPGFRLGEAWLLSTVSWAVTFLSAGFLTLSVFMLRKEDGYELIPSERQYD